MLIAGFAIGAALCGLSPGTLGRADAGGALSLAVVVQKAVSGFTVLGKLRLFFLLLLAAGWCWWRDRADMRRFLRRNTILVGAFVGALFVVMASGFTASRAGFGLELYSLLLLLRLPLRWPFGRRARGAALGALAVAVCALLAGAIVYNYRSNQAYRDMVAQLEDKEGSYIIATELPRTPSVFALYQLPPITASTKYDDTFLDGGWNSAIAAYYGRDSICFLPKRFMEEACSHPERFAEFTDCNGQLGFYARLEKESGTPRRAVFLLRPSRRGEIPFCLRPIAGKLARYSAPEVEEERIKRMELGGRTFVLVCKNPTVDWRLRAVELRD